jgi:hypothetical protein
MRRFPPRRALRAVLPFSTPVRPSQSLGRRRSVKEAGGGVSRASARCISRGPGRRSQGSPASQAGPAGGKVAAGALGARKAKY